MLLNKFTVLKKPFIHRLSVNLIELENEAKSRTDIYLSVIDFENCKTKTQVIDKFAESFCFPDYYSNNWDSFDECINDLSWVLSDYYITIIKNFSCYELNNPKDFNILLKLLNSTAMDWANGVNSEATYTSPKPFHVILQE